MQPQQSLENTVRKRASSAELNRWRDAGVDPELLSAPSVTVAAPESRLAPAVAEWDKSLRQRVLGNAALQTLVGLEER